MTTAEGTTGTERWEEAIEGIVRAYDTGDAAEVLRYFADDAHIIGSLGREVWSRKADVEEPLAMELREFQDRNQTFLPKEEEYAFSPGLESVEFSLETDEMAVVALRGTLEATFRKRPMVHEGRWTCVLQKRASGWEVVHSHFSLALT